MLTAQNKKFYLDGKEFKIQSGAFHYFRALPEYWEDILTKIKAAGLNCVESYTCWNLHEPRKGEFDFTGRLDIERFILTAQKVGLKVILRTGPYICAEWENGGFPSWLLKREHNIRFRCNTEPYMTHLRDWFHVILGKIRPYLEVNGGPVIAMAIENEYGSFGDDFSYLKEVEKIYRDEHMDCLYLAADGNSRYHLATGRSGNHILQGLDFDGPCDSTTFDLVSEADPDSPRFIAEYWAGNYTNWRFPKCTYVSDEVVRDAVNAFVDHDINFNIYMLYGGTSFGFTSAAQGKLTTGEECYTPNITSYDYDAAISEWGGYTQRYFDIRSAMERDHGPIDTPLPKSPRLQYIGNVPLKQSAPLFDNMAIGKTRKSVTIESMEEFDQIAGYILYRKRFDYDPQVNMVKLIGLHDRAHVYHNGKLVAIRMRGEDESIVELDADFQKGDTLDILVENMGRICFGEYTYWGDRKGITEGVILTHRKFGHIHEPGRIPFNWEVTSFEMDDLSQLTYHAAKPQNLPAFFRGTFKSSCQDSCFVRFDNFRKGIIYVNGFNLGRYWERGPLEALYIPGVILKEENEIVVFETDGVKGDLSVEITNICGIGNHHEEIII